MVGEALINHQMHFEMKVSEFKFSIISSNSLPCESFGLTGEEGGRARTVVRALA